jgi:hypothetical protein
MKNKVSIPLSLLLMFAGTYAASAQAQTRSAAATRRPQVTPQTTPTPRNPAPANSSGTSSPAASNGCWLQRGDGLPTQYVCPGSAAGTSTSGNAMNGAASGSAGSQSLCASWLSGRIKVSQQVAQELSRSCFGQGGNSSAQTPSGSLSAGGLKGYTNSLAPGASPAYSPQAGAEAGSFGDTAPQAVDPEAFKAAGSDAVATNMEALMNGSTAASPSNPAGDSGPTDVQLSTADTILEEIHTSAEKIPEAIDNFRKSGFWNATVNFLSTEVEEDLSGAITDIGGVFIDLEKGLLDPGTALGVKAIADQANDPCKLTNAAERSQLSANGQDDCTPATSHQPAQGAPQPKRP